MPTRHPSESRRLPFFLPASGKASLSRTEPSALPMNETQIGQTVQMVRGELPGDSEGVGDGTRRRLRKSTGHEEHPHPEVAERPVPLVQEVPLRLGPLADRVVPPPAVPLLRPDETALDEDVQVMERRAEPRPHVAHHRPEMGPRLQEQVLIDSRARRMSEHALWRLDSQVPKPLSPRKRDSQGAI